MYFQIHNLSAGLQDYYMKVISSHCSKRPMCHCFYPTNSLTAAKDITLDDSVSRVEHETTREQLEGEVKHLTQLLQGALRKQDEMALEAADAWQKVRGSTEHKPRCPQRRTEPLIVSYHSQPLLRPSGEGEPRRAGGPAGAGDVQGEGEPDADVQAGRVPGCCESAQTAGGEPCCLREREEQESEYNTS